MNGISAWYHYLVLVLTAAAAVEVESEEKARTCIEPYVDVDGHCLFFYHLSHTTWENARLECELLNGHLTRIASGNMMEGIAGYINDNSKDWDVSCFWVGATSVTGHWLWLDGEPVKMGTPFWGYNTYPPSQRPSDGPEALNCGALLKDYFYYLYDYSCNTDLCSPLCEQA